MPQLGKNTLAQTFKFDCDRFLRLRLASTAERKQIGLTSDQFKRPGIELVQAAGRRWEIDKYNDLLSVAGQSSIEHLIDPECDELIERHLFRPVENIFDILRRPDPPLAIIEGKFEVPRNLTKNLVELYENYGLDPVHAIPDVVWIRRAPTGAPLIPTGSGMAPVWEIHIIDVKMAEEPTLRHFTEVSFYALALAAALAEEGLAGQYAVSAEGFIWPGSHDSNAFRNHYREVQSKGDPDPLTAALMKTLVAVPYEVYQIHVREFFEERLPRVLSQGPLDTSWHVAPKCQLCENLGFCSKQAETTDHLSRLAWLNEGQAELLRSRSISTTKDLAAAVQGDTAEWKSAVAASHQLRAEAAALLARSQALQTKQPVIVEGRKTALMPAWSDMSIFLTVHFDPGSGITFALGASRVYFLPQRKPGDRPAQEEKVFIVDRVENLNPDSERKRLVEFVRLLTRWLDEAHRENERIRQERHARHERDSDFGKVRVHLFFWDMLEVRQLRRMVERHMTHPDLVEVIDLLVRLVPPENHLPDPDFYKSQPATVVKEVLRSLVGLPLPHTYTLIETANNFYPFLKDDGDVFQYKLAYGFVTPMSDQIPFERAYELWEDRIYLTHFDKSEYSRKEIGDGIETAVVTRMKALQHVVGKLREHHADLLIQRKPAFSAARPKEMRVPEAARKLIAFEKLNAASKDFENRQHRALPIEEREARFISMRGLMPASGKIYEDAMAQVRAFQLKYRSRVLAPFTFSPGSRDARIREGEFLLAVSNEENPLHFDMQWRLHLGLSPEQAENLLAADGLDKNIVFSPLRRLLQVEVARLEANQDPPFLILAPADATLFQFAQAQGVIDLARPLVLDPLFKDFSSELTEVVLRTIGGKAPSKKRGKK